MFSQLLITLLLLNKLILTMITSHDIFYNSKMKVILLFSLTYKNIDITNILSSNVNV